MDHVSVICKLAIKWYLMRMCASDCVPDCVPKQPVTCEIREDFRRLFKVTLHSIRVQNSKKSLAP